MPAAASRKPRGKKAAKDKDTTSRQTSLLDAFGVRASSKKATLATSAAQSDNGSTAGEDIIDIPSSDAEPLTELPVDSSSPMTVEDAESRKDDVVVPCVEVQFAGGSRDAPIVVANSSPLASPVPLIKTKLSNVPSPIKAPPKALFSIFAPRKRPETRESSPSKVYGKPTTLPSAPFPDGSSQHVRGPQCEASVHLSHFSHRDPPYTNVEPTAEVDVSIYSRLTRTCEDEQTSAPSASLYSKVVDPSDSTIRDRCHSSIPLHHRQYPAIRRLLEPPDSSLTVDPEASSTSNLLWNDRWSPKRADEVLGNEQSALYLRDWLVALKLHIHGSGDVPSQGSAASDKKGKQKASKAKAKAKGPRGTKRPRIVRDVERKRRRVDSEEPEDSWIVDDDSEDDPLDLIFASEDDLIGYPISRLRRVRGIGSENDSELASIDETSEEPSNQPPPSDHVPPFSYKPPKFGDTIRNTILLTGPPGCGKTAAVYACAKELGWEVFEVYPGVGDRSGAALQKLIGEVGKNHLVKQTQPKANAAAENKKPHAKPKRNFFAKRVVSDDEDELAVAPVSGAAEQPQEELSQPEPAEVSQSIVLVEEVDILYREDANFWPTMVKIIRECHRPVVMTCNDASLVPMEDLPLQTTLYFSPCPTPLAVSYLQLRSLTEGLETSAALACELYEGRGELGTRHERGLDDLLYPRWISRPLPDLRRTINRLQFGTRYPFEDGHPLSEKTVQDQSLQRLRRIAWSLELCSSADSGLRRSASGVMRDLMSNSVRTCADDVIGLHHLFTHSDNTSSYTPITFSTYHRDEAILDDLFSCAAPHYPDPDDILSDPPDPPLLHTSHCGTMLPILDRLRIPREDLVRDSAALFVDYEPWIRHMVRADDTHIAATLASGQFEGTTRRTRNSQRSQWELQRWISLDEDQRSILSRTALDIGEVAADVGLDVVTASTAPSSQ